MNSLENILSINEVLTADQMRRLNDNCYIVEHNKFENIFSQEKPVSHVMILSSGLVKIYKKDQHNKSMILKIIKPVNYIGLDSVFYGDRYQFSATALEDSKIVYINISIFKEILTESGAFAVQLLKQFSNEGIELSNKLIYFSQKQIPGRIAEVLLFFSNDVYLNYHFALPLSRQELADMVYSTKESVSRTLTEFKNDRIIDLEDRLVTIKSIDLLKILSQVG